MEKISVLKNGSWEEYFHPREYRIEKNRVVFGLANSGPELLSDFVALLGEGVYVLYVLHTPRGEGNAGRYQSPLLSKSNVSELLVNYSEFFSCDSRFDLWFHSPDEGVTIVWDRHNLVYVYGRQQEYVAVLNEAGYCEGNPNMAFPHEHHYHFEYDAQAKSLLSEFVWSFSNLREEDEQ